MNTVLSDAPEESTHVSYTLLMQGYGLLAKLSEKLQASLLYILQSIYVAQPSLQQ